MSKSEMCTVLVMGRNPSLALCQITSILLQKYWSDCPYEIVLCTQTKKPENCLYDRVIYTDEQMIWGDRLKIALENIETKYVILLAEDFFLKDYVSNREIESCIQQCESEQGGAVRLNPPVPFTVKYDEKFDLLPENSIYRICLQPTLFQTEYLRRFADHHFSPWQFERKGSLLSREYKEKLFCAKTAVYNCVHAWGNGMWMKEAYQLLQRENIDKRLYEGKKIYPWYLELKNKIFMLIIKLAPNTITKIRIRMCEKDEKKLRK